MNSSAPSGGRILGTLGTADGKGIVRVQDRFGADIEITLTADGGQTTVVWEERGMPVAYWPVTGRGSRSTLKISAPTSRGASAATPVRGCAGFSPPTRPWRPASASPRAAPDRTGGPGAGQCPHGSGQVSRSATCGSVRSGIGGGGLTSRLAAGGRAVTSPAPFGQGRDGRCVAGRPYSGERSGDGRGDGVGVDDPVPWRRRLLS